MVEVQQAALGETLAVDGFRELGTKIADLSDGDAFRDRVETDLWETFVGVNDPSSDSVAYQDVPDESRSIIGYVEEGDERSVPWWLQSFAWTVSARGEELTLTTPEELSQFKNFDPQATMVQKPVLQDDLGGVEREITAVLDAFTELYEALDEPVTLPDNGEDLSLPPSIFEIEEQRLRTTEEFESWFNDLLQLCPPANDALTALLMVITGVQREAVVDVLPNEVVKQLDKLGVEGDKITEQDYFDPLTTILELDGVFDCIVPQSGDFEELGRLEALFYEIWAETNQDREKAVNKWVQRVADTWNPDTLETGEESQFAEIAFQTPLRLHRDRLVYTTLAVTTKFEYYSRDKTKRKEINNIMRSYGYLEE